VDLFDFLGRSISNFNLLTDQNTKSVIAYMSASTIGTGGNMTEEEIDVVAEELAKVGGLSWYPGRGSGPLFRVVEQRYRDRARVAIAAIDRFRAQKQGAALPQDAKADASRSGDVPPGRSGTLQVGAIVVYRPPGDKRATPCRVEKMEDGRVYLVPCPRPDVGWVSLDSLLAPPVSDNADNETA
jgi:hypothetical protein